MKFGVFTSMGSTTWDDVLALWRNTEKTGWDAAAVTDHFMPNTPDKIGDMLESWTTLAALATLVPRMRVGTIVAGNTYRHPAVLAKMAAQVDIISGGRLICGIGAAWQENEHTAYGIPFGTVSERLARLDEACQVLKLLWTQGKSTFKGRYYELADAPLAPKPVQKPHPELMIGGGGEKVTLRIAARHADHWNVWGGPETLAHKSGILEGYCREVGRDPTKLLRSANMPVVFGDTSDVDKLRTALTRRLGLDESRARDTVLGPSVAAVRDKVAKLRDAGVGMLWVPTIFMREPRPVLDRFIAEVAPAFR